MQHYLNFNFSLQFIFFYNFFILVAVVVAFFICWAPFHAQRLIAIYMTYPTRSSEKYIVILKIYEITTYISGILYYLSTTINPLLYNVMSNKFREAFKVMYYIFIM